MKPQITTLTDILKRIEGRKWDWFGINKYPFPDYNEKHIEGLKIKIYTEKDGAGSWRKFSLADLLSNRSWCEVVWGEELYAAISDVVEWSANKISKKELDEKSYPKWKGDSIEAFKLLQTDRQACLDYIGRTMV